MGEIGIQRLCPFLCNVRFTSMAIQFDDIQLKIQPAGTLCLPWGDFDRAIILINGQDILDIVKREEEKLCQEQGDNSSAGAYHHMRIEELYDNLIEAEKSNGKEEAAILCCTCDESRCSAILTKILKTDKNVLWQDVHNEWINPFKLSFMFKRKEYENFMSQLRRLIQK